MRDNFDVKVVSDGMIKYINDWHNSNGLHNAPDVIGVSGGKDSTACLFALAKARGPENVIAVLMPNGEQKDISDSIRACEAAGVKYTIINIKPMYDAITESVRGAAKNGEEFPNSLYSTNTPARCRMVTLYGVAAVNHGVVVNTSNYSEAYVGYSSKWGDGVGDFSLLGKLFVSEVIEVGKYLGAPVDLMEKAPGDGMCGKTDEDNMGFTYDELEAYIKYVEMSGPKPNDLSIEKADKMYKMHSNPNTEKKLVVKDVYDPMM